MSCMKTFNIGNGYSVFTVTTFLPPVFSVQFSFWEAILDLHNEDSVGSNPLHTERR